MDEWVDHDWDGVDEFMRRLQSGWQSSSPADLTPMVPPPGPSGPPMRARRIDQDGPGGPLADWRRSAGRRVSHLLERVGVGPRCRQGATGSGEFEDIR